MIQRILIGFIGFTSSALAVTDIGGTANEKPVPSLDPDKALLSTITWPEGMQAKVFAKQPDVQDPTAITFDEQNRLYIAETHRFDRGIEDNRRNQHWLREDIALNSTAERMQMYLRHQDVKPLSYYTRYSEVIRVLEDTNQDGVADKAQIYADGFRHPLDGTAAGIMAANGKVYFACIPHVWELKDSDGDLVADQRRSLQDGYGISVSLSGHDLNGFAWGPDGRIYFTIGDRGYNLKTADGRHLHDQYGGAIFRMEPDGSGLEVVHEGLRNPKEIAFDQYGNAFSVDNNADMGDLARVIYMVEGAHSGWNRGHQHFNNFRHAIDVNSRHWQPWMREHIWEMEGENRPAFYLQPCGFVSTGPSGLAYNPGTGLAKKWDDHFLVCDFRGPSNSSVIAFKMKPDGAGYKVANQETFISGFLNTDVEFGYDGRVYVSDYTGSWMTHGEGAVFTFSNPEELKKPECREVRTLFAKGFDTLSADQLSKLLSHADMRVRQRAQFTLAKDPANRDLFLKATAKGNSPVTRLHGVWGLGQIARIHKDQSAIQLLIQLVGTDHLDTKMVGQIAQILGEIAPVKGREAILKCYHSTPFSDIRMLSAIALGKAGNSADIPLLIELLERNKDEDAYLRHGAVQGLRTITRLSGNTKALMAHADHPSPAVRRGLVMTLRHLQDGAIAHFLKDQDPSIVIETIQAINDDYIEAARPALAEATEMLGKSTTAIDNRILNAIYRVGGDDNVRKILKVAADPNLPATVRQEALFLLRRWENPPPVDPTTGKHRPVAEGRSFKALSGEIETALATLLGETKGDLLADIIETIEHFGIEADEDTMLGHYRNANNPSSIRLAAMHILLPAKSANLIHALKASLDDRDPSIRTESFAELSKLEPQFALSHAAKVLATDRTTDRQHLFSVLSSMPQAGAAQIILKSLQALDEQDPTIQLDILEAAQKRTEPAVTQALAQHQSKVDPKDPLAAYRVAMKGGSADEGRRVFYGHGAAECSRCHVGLSGRKGGDAGPSLSNIGHRDAEYLLESIVLPNAKTAPGFGIISLTLKDGSMVAGKLMEQNNQSITVADMATGESKAYARQDIKTSTTPASTMPPMGMILTKREIRDIIAFLETLKQP